MSVAERRWTEALATRAVPDDMLAHAPQSPWVWPVLLFKRVDDRIDTPSYRTALATLLTGATVLGVGAGRTRVLLAPPARRLVGIDPDEGVLAACTRAADEKGVGRSVVHGTCPDVAPVSKRPMSPSATTSSTT